MKRLRWAFLAALPVALLSLTTMSSCQRTDSQDAIVKNEQGGIVGGKLVSVDDPIQKVIVRIFMRSGGKDTGCTGVLISERFVLTAAHCFQQSGEGRAEPDRVFLGNGIEASPKNVFLHPSYDDFKDFNRFDLALLEIQSGNIIETAVLPVAGEAPIPGVGYSVAGYGRRTIEVIEENPKLYKLETKVSIPEFTMSELVAFSSDHTGTCYGDSGGPLYSIESGRVKVFSVLSRGTPDSKECLGSDVHTRVEPVLGWVQQVLAGQISPRTSLVK